MLGPLMVFGGGLTILFTITPEGGDSAAGIAGFTTLCIGGGVRIAGAAMLGVAIHQRVPRQAAFIPNVNVSPTGASLGWTY